MPDTATDTVESIEQLPAEADAAAREALDDVADDINDADVAASIVEDDARHLRIIVKRLAHLSEGGRAYLRTLLFPSDGR